MNKVRLLPIVFAVSMTIALPLQLCWAQDSNGANKANVRKALIDLLTTQLPSNSGDAQTQKTVLNNELDLQEKILDEVTRLGLDKRTKVISSLELARRQVLIQTYWADFFERNPVPESNVRGLYENLRIANGSKQYRLKQIVVKDMPIARKVMDDLNRKKSFADVAKQYSEDTQTNQQGGDIGWHWKTDVISQISSKLESVKIGELIGPLEVSPGAIAVIKVEEIRDQEYPSYEQVKPAIENSFRQQAQQAELVRLRGQ